MASATRDHRDGVCGAYIHQPGNRGAGTDRGRNRVVQDRGAAEGAAVLQGRALQGRGEGLDSDARIEWLDGVGAGQQFEQIVLRTTETGGVVRLKDVARIEQAPFSERSSVRLNGVPAVSVGVIRNATANPANSATTTPAAKNFFMIRLPVASCVRSSDSANCARLAFGGGTT